MFVCLLWTTMLLDTFLCVWFPLAARTGVAGNSFFVVVSFFVIIIGAQRAERVPI